MILVAGNINYDILFPLDRLPGPHEKVACEGARTGFGGSAANTAYWLARLGVEVSFAGTVGYDELGSGHIKQLFEAGVITGGVDRVQTATGIAVIFSIGREKRMVRAPGANMAGKADPSLVKGCSLVYLSGGDIGTLSHYAAAARENGIPVICGAHGAMEMEHSGASDGYILNSDELSHITGMDDPEEGLRALDSDIGAVTLSTGGCLVSRGIEVIRVPGDELEPLDRTGGGDAFAAGFLAGLHEGKNVQACGEIGNKLASMVIMEMGARPEVPIEDLKLRIGK